MPTATIRLFLAFADPGRLRTAELSNWTGKAIAGPKSDMSSILGREESRNPGVYLLAGTDPETGRRALYVGEAESISDRLRSHLGKDFWNQIVFFVSKDENLTKAHIRYLEGRLIELARKADRAALVNGQSSGAKLPESDREDMEVFLEKICQLLPVLGVDLLLPPSEVGPRQALLTCEIKGLTATGHVTPRGFLVRQGSQAVMTERPSAQKYPWPVQLRNELKQDGTLVQESDHLRFARAFEFSSPSAAAAVVHGGHANGLTAWRDSEGRTLKELESS